MVLSRNTGVLTEKRDVEKKLKQSLFFNKISLKLQENNHIITNAVT